MTPLDRFSLPTRTWFEAAFGAPTAVQAAAWGPIADRSHTLVIAPTGSGKTLAAFLAAIDQAMTTEPTGGVRVLYVSPLKALGVDVERNLQVPLAGIARTAVELGLPTNTVRVGVRTGDTPAADRRRLAARPPQILITTPESLFLMLSSGVAETLTGVETVIVDEVHYLVGNKRGAHLAVSLERLDAASTVGGAQRIGLSATVRPPEVARDFLAGRGRDMVVVDPPATKTYDLKIRVPVEDMTDLPRSQPSMWPPVEQQIFELITTHRSTICFSNSRGVAERLTAHLNALYREAVPADPDGVIARTHHGSVAKPVRSAIEEDLKAGRLPCVVATNSLELGIDMGAVDLVIQVSTPPSVASGVQRIGRGGHHVGAVSTGVLFPLSRGDLLSTAVVTERMESGQIEALHRLSNPLDVLAQHLVSMCLDAPVAPDTLKAVVRRADCYADLPDAAFDSVLGMLTGAYPAEEFAGLRPRLAWDRGAGTVVARPGARRLVTTSGGTIPDRGLYQVVMAGSGRVGELDEEMVYESRVGDVFTLGTTAWRMDEITQSQVIVSPVPGATGKVPFWHGDEVSRPAEVGRAIGDLAGALAAGSPPPARLDPQAAANLTAYIDAQKAATSVVPDTTTILVERHRDELGAWRVCIHCHLGKAVLRPWAMAISRRLREVAPGGDADVRVLVSDDGITIRLGEVDEPSIGHLLGFAPEEITRIVTEETLTSTLFAAHFRQCAARALLLPRRDPGQRSPLWQQRLRSAQLLAVAGGHPGFPIMAEALRECLDDVFDLDTLRDLMERIAARRVRIVEVATARPSPFAASLLFGYTGAYMYDEDQPLAERAAANAVDAELLAALLGRTAPTTVDPGVLAGVEARLQRLTHKATSAEAFWDLLRDLGPLTGSECAQRCSTDPSEWIAALRAAGRVADVTVGGAPMVVVSDDVGWVSTPGEPDDLRRVVVRWTRHHGVVRAADIASRYGVEEAAVAAVLDSLVAGGSVTRGVFLAGEPAGYMAGEVRDRVRRRTVLELRERVRPVAPGRYGSFLYGWHELDAPGRGYEGLLAAVEQVAGYPVAASMLESHILPARVADYHPGLLDEAMLAGDVTWSGCGAAGKADGYIALWPGDVTPLVRPVPLDDLTAQARATYGRLADGGAWTAAGLVGDGAAGVLDALWELVWAGLATADSLAPVRALVRGNPAPRRTPAPRVRRVVRAPAGPRPTPGRWMALAEPAGPPTARLVSAVGLQLARYGILAKPAIQAEPMTPAFLDAYRVLAAMESEGTVRRGYFVDGLGGAQFALPGAVDRLRSAAAGLRLLAAGDPANPWGATLPWPSSGGHPGRHPGALVVADDDGPVVYLERGAHTLVTFGAGAAAIAAGLRVIGEAIDQGRLEAVTVTRVDGRAVLAERAWHATLADGGFTMVPQGFRRHPRVG